MATIDTLTRQAFPGSSDKAYVLDGSNDKYAEIGDIVSSQGASARWTTINTTSYTATPASTSSITLSDTTGLSVGLPVSYAYGGATYYGIITAVVANTSITIAGATLDTGTDLTALNVGRPEGVVVMPYFVSSTYGDGVADLLSADMNAYVRWKGTAAHLVQYEATHATADTGASEPKINAKVGGNLVGTEDSNNGLQLSGTPGTWVASSAVAISTSNYATAYGDAIEVRCTAAGSNSDAENLSGNLIFVLA